MQVKKLSESSDAFTVNFRVEQTTPAFINTIRRAVIDKVPTLAIEDVEFQKNNSALFDEMFAHRLGLVSLTSDLQSYTFRQGEGSAANECAMSLEAQGPMIVTAGMFKSTDPKVVPVYPETILVELLEGQSLSIVAKATLGLGSEHAKWSSGLSYYAADAKVTVKNGAGVEQYKTKLPAQAFDAKGQLSADAIIQHNLIDAVEGVCPEFIKVDYDNTAYTMTVESWGQHAAKTVVLEAVKSIQQEFQQLLESVEVLR